MKRSRTILSIVIVFFWASEYAHVPYFTPVSEASGLWCLPDRHHDRYLRLHPDGDPYSSGHDHRYHQRLPESRDCWISKNITGRFGDKWAIFSGFGCMAVSCLLVGLAPNICFLYLAQIIGGIGNILLISLLMALCIRTVPMERKSTAMGLFQALYGIGMTAGPVLIGRIVESRNYTIAYMIFAGIATVTMLLALVLVPWMEKQIIRQDS